jgi:hypothetical protein
MTQPSRVHLTEAERQLREQFEVTKQARRVSPSDARAGAQGGVRQVRLQQLVLPEDERGRMPFTKSQYLIKENPQEIFWERELRKFLRRLSPEHEHRVSAVMVWEWATGLSVADLEAAIKAGTADGKATHRSDLRKLNALLRHYFGKGYMTYIAGRKVPRAYKVRKGYYIKRHRPLSLTLYAEYCEGTLVA